MAITHMHVILCIDALFIQTYLSIVGAGGVGSTIAAMTMSKNVADEILLVDSMQDFLKGQVLDLSDANINNGTKVRSATWKEAGQADVIVITAGAKQRSGESRQELVDRNYEILKQVIGEMQPIQKDAVMLLVSNPVDVLTSIAQKLAGLPRNRVFGSGTFLDSSRLNVYLSDKLNISPSSISAYVLGEHGDSQFIAWESASVGGRPLLSFPEIQALDKESIRKQVSNKAMDIIRYKGSTFYGIGACATSLCESILRNTLEIRPVSVHVDNLDTVLSVPAKIGAGGAEEVFPIPLSEDEQQKLLQSAQTVKEVASKYM
ncbi:lactate dehydrogenase B [Lichtheimia hyalospora FSU 10163]|nr:lactate dehydrogenase B [Lichtheimia hyalospora FSU 10163]